MPDRLWQPGDRVYGVHSQRAHIVGEGMVRVTSSYHHHGTQYSSDLPLTRCGMAIDGGWQGNDAFAKGIPTCSRCEANDV